MPGDRLTSIKTVTGQQRHICDHPLLNVTADGSRGGLKNAACALTWTDSVSWPAPR